MTATAQPYPFKPDFAPRPGSLIQEYLDALDISARELARRCGRSAKLITEIILGKAPIEPDTALQLERVLDVDASIWIGLESQYRLHEARERDEESLSEFESWAKKFPTSALCQRGFISCEAKGTDLVVALLRFFGVGNVEALRARFEDLLAADLRTSPAYTSELESLAAWLRIGEIRAEEIDPDEFDREKFRNILQDIRKLTCEPFESAIAQLPTICATAGVAFVFEQSLGKISTSGASRWLSSKRALIQQSGRYRADDHFWFTFFHECAHLLLHSKKQVFVDVMQGQGSATTAQENEANDWAADFLIPTAAMRKFIRSFNGTEEEVLEFADRIEIAPGIVVGQLQHRRILNFNQMNHLRHRYDVKELAV
jgi:addiction module HigA family antidote